MIHYTLINTTREDINEQPIRLGLQAAEAKLGEIGDRFVSIEFVTSEAIQKVNLVLRHKNEPTDIISLSTQEKESGEQIIYEQADGSLDFHITPPKGADHTWPALGQLIICHTIVAQNAQSARQPIERELEWVVEHGTLHLMGYHHKK